MDTCRKFFVRGFLSTFCFKGGGLVCWGLGRTTTVSDVHTHPILCARKARVPEHNHVPSKICGHEIGVISGHAQNLLLFRENSKEIVVTLSGCFWADLLGAFWGSLVGTFLGDFAGHCLHSPGAATVAMQFCLWGVFIAQLCVLQALLSFVPIGPNFGCNSQLQPIKSSDKTVRKL